MPNEAFVISGRFLEKYNGCEGEVVIPDVVEVIGADAFRDNSFILSVEIPEGVREIQCGAFKSCVNLKRVTMPRSLKKLGMGAFAMCASLEEIDIPEGVTDIGCSAFYGCRSLKTVNYNAVRCRSIRSEGNYNYYTYTDYGNFYDDIFPVFYACHALKTVNIGSAVKYIPDELFRFSALRRINVSCKNKLKIAFNAFSADADLRKIIKRNTDAEIVLEPYKPYSFPSVEIEAGVPVMHKIWGDGTVLEVISERKLIKVGFSFIGIKIFMLPDAFRLGHLKRMD